MRRSCAPPRLSHQLTPALRRVSLPHWRPAPGGASCIPWLCFLLVRWVCDVRAETTLNFYKFSSKTTKGDTRLDGYVLRYTGMAVNWIWEAPEWGLGIRREGKDEGRGLHVYTADGRWRLSSQHWRLPSSLGDIAQTTKGWTPPRTEATQVTSPAYLFQTPDVLQGQPNWTPWKLGET